MGYPARILDDMFKLGLGPGQTIGDCGSQDFSAAQRDWVNILLQRHFDAPPLEFDGIIPAREVFERIGMHYTSFDIDERSGTEYLDFHSLAFPRKFYDMFNVTFNSGTSEHLIAPIALMFFMHQATKVGGLMWHIVPIFGWTNHGLNNLTAKFWHLLATYNDYEVISACLLPTPVEENDPNNFFGEHLDFIEGLRDFSQNPALVQVIFRKKHNFCFVPPFDVDEPWKWSPERSARVMRDALMPFVKADSIEVAEVDRAVEWRFGISATSTFSRKDALAGVSEAQFLSSSSHDSTSRWRSASYTVQDACDHALALMSSGQYGDAAQLLRAVRQRHPGHAEAAYQLGWAEAQLGDMNNALENFAVAAGLVPDDERYCRGGEDCMREYRYVRIGREVLTVQAACDRAMNARSTGDISYAVTLLSDIVRLHPDHGFAREELMSLWRDQLKAYEGSAPERRLTAKLRDLLRKVF